MKNNKIFMLIIAVALIGTTEIAWAQKTAKVRSASNYGANSYEIGIGFRAGYISGLSVKHFVSSTAAVEGILGSRWHGVNISGLYELHKGNALGVNRLNWEYGGGARLGFYDGKYYRDWDKDMNYEGSNYTVVSIVGVFGMEYHFKEIPFTAGFDILPYFDFIGKNTSFIDGSLSVRYLF